MTRLDISIIRHVKKWPAVEKVPGTLIVKDNERAFGDIYIFQL